MNKNFGKCAVMGIMFFTAMNSMGINETFADEIKELYAQTAIEPVDYNNQLNIMLSSDSDDSVAKIDETEVTGSSIEASGVPYEDIEAVALAKIEEQEKEEQKLAKKKMKEMEQELQDYEDQRNSLIKKIKRLEAKKIKAQKEAEEAKAAKKAAKKAAEEEAKKKKEEEKAASENSSDSSSSSNSTTTTYDENLKVTYSEDDKDILRKIIAAEAGDQGYQGMEYVAEVIRNRCVKYKKSVYDVVFAKNQFSPVSNGTYYTAYSKLTKSEKADVEAAIEAIEAGAYEAQGAMYFKMYGYHSGCTPLFKYKDHYFSK